MSARRRNWRAALCTIQLGLCLGLAAAARAAAPGGEQAVLGLRTGEHDGYSRLVFDWTAPVGYRVEQAPGRAVLHFDRPARLDLSRFRADPPKLVTKAQARRTDAGLTVELTLPPGAGLRHFLSGPKVVLDVLAPQAASGAAEAAAAPAAAEPAPGSETPAARPTRLKPGKSERQPPPAPRRPAKAAVTATTQRPARTPAKSGAGISFTFERASLPALSPIPGPGAPRFRPVTLRAVGAADAAVAAFRRGRSLWLVFDRPAVVDISGRLARFAPELAPLEQRLVNGATVIRLTAPAELAPALRRLGNDWLVDLRPQLAPPEAAIKATVRPGKPYPGVLFTAAGAGRLVVLDDPELGGKIFVLPVRWPRLGLPAAREFARFRALPTYQGVVLAARSDGLEVALAKTGLEVKSAAGPLATPETEARRKGAQTDLAAPVGRLFDLPAWRRGDGESFERERKRLQRRLVAPGPGDRQELLRLELGRFYFAHGMATEALSVLQRVARDNPRLARDPEVILLQAASLFLVKDYRAVADGLAEPALAGEADALVWRGALAAVAQDWSYAAEAFDRTGALIADYAGPVRSRLRLLAAEARLGIGDSGGASLYLEQVRADQPTAMDLAQVSFLEGRRLLLDDEVAMAKSAWRRAARGIHVPSRARARLALVDLGLKTATMEAAAAIEELERLRFAWRGDAFEVALFERLGELYVDVKDYRAALDALRQAASHFPGSPRAEAVTRRMREIFEGLYLEGGDAALPPIRALALYEEFKELTPIGPAGDRMIARLVERLIEVELLERAAALLKYQIARRLTGAERVRAGARLAAIHLLDQAPQQALDALAATRGKGVAADLRRERRQVEARALSALGRGRDGLALLAGDDSPDAQRLRVEMLWELRDWPAAAVALARLVPPKPPSGRDLDRAETRAVVDLAVAYSLAGDRKQLAGLRRRYGAAMAAGPEAASFALLTGESGRPDVTRIAEQLAGVERIQAFIESYRAGRADGADGDVN